MAHRDGFSHLRLGQPTALAHEIALHLPGERDWSSETECSEPQEVARNLANSSCFWGRGLALSHEYFRGGRP